MEPGDGELAARVAKLERQVAALLTPGAAIAGGALPNGMLRRADAARALGLKPTTLNRWAVQRIGPAFVLWRNKAYYQREELDRWMQENVRAVCRGAHDASAAADAPLLAGL